MKMTHPPVRTPIGKYVWYGRYILTRVLLFLINLVNYTDEAAVLVERRYQDGGAAYFGTGTGNPANLIDFALEQVHNAYPDSSKLESRDD